MDSRGLLAIVWRKKSKGVGALKIGFPRCVVYKLGASRVAFDLGNVTARAAMQRRIISRMPTIMRQTMDAVLSRGPSVNNTGSTRQVRQTENVLP